MFHANQDLSLCLFALYMFEWAAEMVSSVSTTGTERSKLKGIVSQCSLLRCSLPAVGQIAGNTCLLVPNFVGGKLIEGDIICGEQLKKDGFALHLQVTSFFRLSATRRQQPG